MTAIQQGGTWMLFADTPDAATWIGIGTVIGAVIGALATAWIKVNDRWFANKRQRDRDAIADYQRLLDVTEVARSKTEEARNRMEVEIRSLMAENLRLKAMVGDKDSEIAGKDMEITELREALIHRERGE